MEKDHVPTGSSQIYIPWYLAKEGSHNLTRKRNGELIRIPTLSQTVQWSMSILNDSTGEDDDTTSLSVRRPAPR
jgi:hypothetical protein